MNKTNSPTSDVERIRIRALLYFMADTSLEYSTPVEAAYQCMGLMAALFCRYPEAMYAIADRAGFTGPKFDTANQVFSELESMLSEAA